MTSPPPQAGRSHQVSSLLLVVTLVLGLASRKYSRCLPWFLSKNAGDILYATFVFWLIGLAAPRLSTARTAAAATAFCFFIEFWKFYHGAWMEAVRHTGAGRLVFGVGFHGSNLVCYVIGVALAAGIERWLIVSNRAAPCQSDGEPV